MSIELLTTIILACQVPSMHGHSNEVANYKDLMDRQISCQNLLIKCVQEKDKKQKTGDSLTECLLER